MKTRPGRLADLCDRAVERFDPATWPSDALVYVDVSAVDARRKVITAPKIIPVDQAPSRAQSVLRQGDILVSTVRPNLNAVSRVPAELEGAVGSSAFAVLRCHDQVLADLLFCFVQSPGFVQYLADAASGTNYPAVNDRQVFEAEFAVPRAAADGEFASRLLSGLDTARAAAILCEEQLDNAEALAPRILAELFQGILPISAEPAKCSLPSGWASMPLGRVSCLESGHTPSRRHPEWWNGPIPWLALPDIRKLHGKFAYETAETINDAGLANSSARLLPVGTVCVSRTASIGFVTILGRPMATSQDFCNWVCDPNKMDPEFLMYAFMASQDYLRELGSGAVHKTIYMPTIQSFHVCAPGIEEQRRIARTLRERLAAAEALTAGLRARLSEIERLPERLLAATFGSAA